MKASGTVVSRIELPAISPDQTGEGQSLGERLDLIEHVNVSIDVIVGQASLPISKLFAMKTGEVLALDSVADAPINVELNGRVIAKGELLAIGDNFGIRITEINSAP